MGDDKGAAGGGAGTTVDMMEKTERSKGEWSAE